jgi:hypothetical protein
MANVDKEIKKLELELNQVTRTKSILNQNQIQKLWNSTNKKYKYNRPAKGGGEWTFVKGSYVRKVLDSVFGFNWDFDVETSVEEAFNVASKTGVITVKGILICRVKDDDGVITPIKKVQFGRAEVKWLTEGKYPNKKRKIDEYTGMPVPLDFGSDCKAAATDAFKKCASLLGIASDVYEAGEFLEITIVDSYEDKEAGAKRLIEKNAEVLKTESEVVK